MDLKLVSLHVYPIKSCAGIAVPSLEIGPRGPRYDREWMVIDDATGEFLTQRQQASMARVTTALNSEALLISIPGHSTKIEVPLEATDGPRVKAKVWNDFCAAYEPSTAASEAFSDFLGQRIRLVRMAPEFTRMLPDTYAVPGAHTGFADQFPFLLTHQASLDELNSRLASSSTKVPMSRFRPNIVVEGRKPFDEDGWSGLKVGAIEFKVAKPCARCIIINTDQETGARSAEPLKTLSTYRRNDKNKVLFGQNLIHLREGTIRIGEPVEAW